MKHDKRDIKATLNAKIEVIIKYQWQHCDEHSLFIAFIAYIKYISKILNWGFNLTYEHM